MTTITSKSANDLITSADYNSILGKIQNADDSDGINTQKVIITDGSGAYMQLPSLTTTQRDALTTVNGMLIYNSTTTTVQSYENGSWISMGGDITGVTAGSGLTGGGTSGTVNIDIGSGSGITVAADAISIDNTVVCTLSDTQTLSNKTLTTPTIASFTNATHNHSNAAGGGTISTTDVTEGTNLYFTTARVDTQVQGASYTVTGLAWTFNNLPKQPSYAAPTADEEFAPKKYVDDQLITQDQFTELTDTPSTYVGQGGKGVRVNATPDALEFFDLTTANISEVTNLYYTEARVTANTNVTANTTHRSSDGSDHTFLDQSVISGATPTFSATNFSDGGSNAIITTTQETNFESAYAHVSADGSSHTYIDQAVTITGSPTHANLTISNSPTNNAHATRKDYVDGLVQGLDWQESVKDIVDNTAVPPTEISGDRYLLDTTGGGVHANWDGAAINDIVEFNGTTWDISYDASANEGGSAWIEDEDINYTWNATAWVKFGSTITHNNTSGLQGGTTAQYYHMTSAEHTEATRDATNVQNGLMPTGKLTNWDAAFTHVSADGTSHANVILNDTHRGTTTGNPHSVTKSEVGLGSVENTALSTWAGTSSITTVGTIGSGTWQGTVVDETYGGTAQSTFAAGDILYASAANTLSKLAKGANGEVLTLAAGLPSWAAGGGGVSDLEGAFDGGQTISILNTENRTLAISNVDTTSNPITVSITNSTTGTAFFIDQNGNATAGLIDNAGTGHALSIQQVGVLATSKRALDVYSNAIQVNAPLIKMHMDNASSTQPLLNLQNDGTGASFFNENNGTGHGTYTNQVGVLAASKYGLYVYSNAVQVNSALTFMHLDNVSSTNNVMNLTNDGTGYSELVKQVGVLASGKTALKVLSDTAQTTGEALVHHKTAASTTIPNTIITQNGTGHGLSIQQGGVLAAGKNALYVYSNAIQTSAPLFRVHMDNASSSIQTAVIINDGTGDGLILDQNGLANCLQLDNSANGGHILFVGDPTISSPTDGQFWFDGTELKIRIGATTYNLDKTAA